MLASQAPITKQPHMKERFFIAERVGLGDGQTWRYDAYDVQTTLELKRDQSEALAPSVLHPVFLHIRCDLSTLEFIPGGEYTLMRWECADQDMRVYTEELPIVFFDARDGFRVNGIAPYNYIWKAKLPVAKMQSNFLQALGVSL